MWLTGVTAVSVDSDGFGMSPCEVEILFHNMVFTGLKHYCTVLLAAAVLLNILIFGCESSPISRNVRSSVR